MRVKISPCQFPYPFPTLPPSFDLQSLNTLAKLGSFSMKCIISGNCSSLPAFCSLAISRNAFPSKPEGREGRREGGAMSEFGAQLFVAYNLLKEKEEEGRTRVVLLRELVLQGLHCILVACLRPLEEGLCACEFGRREGKKV